MNETITTPPPEKQTDDHDRGESMRGDIGENLRHLQTRFNRMLLATAAFIVISIFALGDFSSFPSLPEDIRKILGTPPSANMINAALIVYSFSAILLILSRMMGGYGNYGGMAHVGYLAAFYGFYHFSGTLNENFWAVFAAGITILCLETYHVWIYCLEQIKKAQETPGKKRGSG
jgi:hypothetical protein